MEQWFSNFSLYQNHLTELLKHILFVPIPTAGLRICVFHSQVLLV